MNTAVRYFTRGGNTKKVADAIANAAGVEAKDCSASLTETVDLLFLGGSVYWGGIDKNLIQFIEKLDPAMVKCVAVFGTSALKKELSSMPQLFTGSLFPERSSGPGNRLQLPFCGNQQHS